MERLERHRKPWSDDDIAYVDENYSTKSIVEIARHLGRTIPGCRAKVSKVGIRHASKRRWTAGDEEVLKKMYEAGESEAAIAETLERSAGSVKGKVNALGIRRAGRD